MKITITAPAGGIAGHQAQVDYIRSEMTKATVTPTGVANLAREYGGSLALAQELQAHLTGKIPLLRNVQRQVQRMIKGELKNPEKSRYKDALAAAARAKLQKPGNTITVQGKGRIRISKDVRDRTTSQFDIPGDLFDQVLEDPVAAFDGSLGETDAAKDIHYEPDFTCSLERMDEIIIEW